MNTEHISLTVYQSYQRALGKYPRTVLAPYSGHSNHLFLLLIINRTKAKEDSSNNIIYAN